MIAGRSGPSTEVEVLGEPARLSPPLRVPTAGRGGLAAHRADERHGGEELPVRHRVLQVPAHLPLGRGELRRRPEPVDRGYHLLDGQDEEPGQVLRVAPVRQVDQGSAQGVAVDDPVLSGVSTADLKAGGSLVGRVTAVTASTAEVTLLSDPAMAVAASVVGRNGANGVLEPNSGDRSTQILDFVRKSAEVAVRDQVVTSGFADPSGKLPSFFPAGIPIGIVTFENQSDTDNYKTIQVTPWVDLLSFRTVLILTRGGR